MKDRTVHIQYPLEIEGHSTMGMGLAIEGLYHPGTSASGMFGPPEKYDPGESDDAWVGSVAFQSHEDLGVMDVDAFWRFLSTITTPEEVEKILRHIRERLLETGRDQEEDAVIERQWGWGFDED